MHTIAEILFIVFVGGILALAFGLVFFWLREAIETCAEGKRLREKPQDVVRRE